MGVEFELKYAATPEILAQLQKDLSPTRTVQMRTTYFDSADGALAARHITLRLRQEDDVTICTIKAPCPDGSREEWECQHTDIYAGVLALCKLGAPRELPMWTLSGLLPVCGAAFTRQILLHQFDGCTVEIALDQGILTGGGKESPLCEVEVELKSGNEAQAAAFAATLAQTYGLQPETRSKFRRALALARGEEDGI